MTTGNRPPIFLNHADSRALADAQAEIERLRADQAKGGEDYCALMARHDSLHNEVERLRQELDASCNAEELRQVREERDRLRREVRYLRCYGNNDCTRMADEAMACGLLERTT